MKRLFVCFLLQGNNGAYTIINKQITLITTLLRVQTFFHQTFTITYYYYYYYSGQDFDCPVFFEAWGNKCYYFQGAHNSFALAEFTCNNLAATPVSFSVKLLITSWFQHETTTYSE